MNQSEQPSTRAFFEQQLIESEARYRAIGESIDFGVWMCDANGRNTYASESFLRLVGLTREQWSDFGWGDVLHPDDADATIAAWKECVRTQGNWEREHRFRGADGQWYHVLAKGVPLRNATGDVVGWAGINLDVTRLVRSEREVVRLAAESLRQRRLYETVLTNTPDLAYVFDLSHRFTYANQALLTMWGRTWEDAVGKSCLELGYEPWHAEMHDREIEQVVATRLPIRGEVAFVGTNGRRHYDYIFVPVIGANGEVEAVAGTSRDVTDRKEAEKKLRESEERSAFVRRSSGVGFWYCDLPFDVLQWDNLVKAHFHLPPDAAVTIQTFYDRIHPDDREPTRRAIEQSIATRTPYKTDYRTVHPETGAVTWVRAVGRTFYADDGTPTRFDGVTLDVSEQKRAEEQQAFLIRMTDTLRPLSDPVEVQAEASRLLGEYLGANRVLYFEIRGDEYVIERDYTAGVQPLAGRYPVSAFGSALIRQLTSGRTVIEADATSESNRNAAEQAAFAAIQVRGHVDVPLVKDGRFVAGLTVHCSTRREWTQQEVALIESTAERTWEAVERVRAEVALRQSEERRRMALDAAELGAWHLDLASNTLNTDERFRMIVAGSTAELDFDQAFATVHPADQQRIREAVATATRSVNPAPYAEEYRVVHPDGSVRWVFGKGRASCDRESEGRPVRLDGTVADITARKNIEHERELLVGKLKDADRRKDEFLATLAHELRNPMAPMRNGLHIMRLAGSTGTIDHVRAMLERQLTQLVRLVDDLLDVSRVTSGKLALRRDRIDLRAVIEAALETSRPVIEQAGLELVVSVPDEPIVLQGDATRLAQVVSNLLNNAAKYTPRGGHVQMHVTQLDNSAVLAVSDSGIGIPPHMLGSVFEMFTQVDRALEKKTGGLGIGLSLVKGLVEMHGGTVAARSDGEGKGSQFLVSLPLSFATTSTADASTTGESMAPSVLRRILVTDDYHDSANSLGQLFEMMGHDVCVANDGLQAVQLAESFRPNLILLDIGMPKLNGYDACSRIRQQAWGRKPFIVAMTGWGQDEDKRRSLEAGFDLHLVKPIDVAVLEELLGAQQADGEELR
jgi:PAS domain S-box-containing protein